MQGTQIPLQTSDLLRRLLDDVATGTDVLRQMEPAAGHALLDAAALHLAERRSRVIRVAADLPGGLNLSGLLQQVSGQVYLTDHHDQILERDFITLTMLDDTCDRIVLLVSGAHALQASALRYIQLACTASEDLHLVFAGAPGLPGPIDEPEFAALAARLRKPVSSAKPQGQATPAPALPETYRAPAPAVPVRPAFLWPAIAMPQLSRRTGIMAAMALGMVAIVVLGADFAQPGKSPPKPQPEHARPLATLPMPPSPVSSSPARQAPDQSVPVQPAPTQSAPTQSAPTQSAPAQTPEERPTSLATIEPQSTSGSEIGGSAILSDPTANAAIGGSAKQDTASPATRRHRHTSFRRDPGSPYDAYASSSRSAHPLYPPVTPGYNDPYGRPPPVAPDPRMLRPETGFYDGWNQIDNRPAIGTYTTGANGIRTFRYGP